MMMQRINSIAMALPLAGLELLIGIIQLGGVMAIALWLAGFHRPHR